METQRIEFPARGGVCLRPTLVLVSRIPDSDAERHDNLVSSAGFNSIAGSHRRAQHFFRNRRGVAAFRNGAACFSAGELGRGAAIRKNVLRCLHRGLRANRSDREIRIANLWRWGGLADKRPPGPFGVCVLSKTGPEQSVHKFLIYL